MKVLSTNKKVMEKLQENWILTVMRIVLTDFGVLIVFLSRSDLG